MLIEMIRNYVTIFLIELIDDCIALIDVFPILRPRKIADIPEEGGILILDRLCQFTETVVCFLHNVVWDTIP